MGDIMLTESAEARLLERAAHRVADLARRAQLGDERAMPTVRYPSTALALIEPIHDLATQAQDALVRALADYDTDSEQALKIRLAERREQLLVDGDSAVERMLIERALTCELQVAHADAGVDADAGISIAQGTFLLRRQMAAHRRLLMSLRALADVRRLPAVGQLNIAQNQTNLAAVPASREITKSLLVGEVA